MCLFSYYETPHQIIMTHNRDESITRGNLASQPILHQVTNPTYSHNKRTILYPEDVPPQNSDSIYSDPQNLLDCKKNNRKKGTWWGCETTTGKVAFILNGALMDTSLPTTLSTPSGLPKLSRGHIIPQLLANEDSLTNYVRHTDWSRFADFTLFYFTPTSPTQNQGQGQLQRFIWNGHQANIKIITKRDFLYLSSTLYQTSDKKVVANLFSQTLTSQSKTKVKTNPVSTSSTILDSHQTCEYQHLSPKLIKVKENTKTVSRTQIKFDKSNANISIYYQDFNFDKKFTYSNKILIQNY